MRRHRSPQDYKTPDEFMARVWFRFGWINWDLAASKANAQVSEFFTTEQDSLKQDWHAIVENGWLWLNPPFGNIEPWAKKCAEEMRLGAKILFLTPASIGANWFAKHVHGNATVIALQGRLSFDGKAPFPKDCILSVYHAGLHGFDVWDWRKTPAA